jgi:replicative DNA helicase
MTISGTNTADRVKRELLANAANIAVTKLDKPHELSSDEISKLETANVNLSTIEILTPSYRVIDHIEEIIDEQCKNGKKVFFIDSLQNLLIGPFERKYAANFEQEFSSNCKRLCDIIKSRSITVVALSLLNKDIDKENKPGSRQDLRAPILADLRDSNVLTQSAYNIIFLHRQEYYDRNKYIYHYDDDNANTAYFSVARNGNRTGQSICLLQYDKSTGFFVEKEEEPGREHRPIGFKKRTDQEAHLLIQKGSKMNDMDFEDEGLEDPPF